MEERNDKPKLVFEPLDCSKHDRAAFSCGDDRLDAYIKKQAGQDAEKNLCAVFILTPDGKTIAGFYTLSQHSVELDKIPEVIAKKLTKYTDVPATLIGRLARSNAYRGAGVGEELLMDALHRCLVNSRQIASWAVVVDAKDEDSAAFYKKFGFREFPRTPMKLFMPMLEIEKMFA